MNYPLEWLELIITQYKPTKEIIKNKGMSHTGIMDQIHSLAEKECTGLRTAIREEILGGHNEKAVKSKVRRFHLLLTEYMDCFHAMKEQTRHPTLLTIYETVLEQLCGVITFIESDCARYLGLDRKMPKSRIEKEKELLACRLTALCKKSGYPTNGNPAAAIVVRALERFVRTVKHHYRVTYSCIGYRRELLRKLESVSDSQIPPESFFCPWDRLLVLMNFNSKTYMDYLIGKFKSRIDTARQTTTAKLDVLFALSKEFRQLHSRTDIAFNPDYTSLDEFITNWFDQEIGFLQSIRELPPQTEPAITEKADDRPKKSTPKVLCNLSSDQIALLIRATDETRMLAARSMTEVFRSIVPNLSTPHRKDLSYESVRSKSYQAEQRDKEVVIDTLHRMIRKIEDY